jgi:hypothetical protein
MKRNLFTLFLTVCTFWLLCLIPSGISAQTCRDVWNGKSGNNPGGNRWVDQANWDDIGMPLPSLYAPNTYNTFTFIQGAKFQENSDGTARLTGTIVDFNDINRKFDVDFNFTGRTTSGTPYNQTGANSANWYYYTWGTATLTGAGSLAGAVLQVVERGGFKFQVGTGANQLWNADDRTAMGAGGWLGWTVVSQPTSGPNLLNYSNGDADINVLVSGSTPCGGTGDPCASDNTRPTISGCPANIALTTAGNSAVANWTAPTATDNCGTPTLTSSANSGASFPIGSTTVTYTARDAAGNTATCSFVVTVTGSTQTCDNVVAGGTISKSCGTNQVIFSNTTLPTGGTGAIEYLWFKSVGCTGAFEQIPNTNSASLTVNSSSERTCYLRCARRAGCTAYVGESNIIIVEANECVSGGGGGSCKRYDVVNANQICPAPASWIPYTMWLNVNGGTTYQVSEAKFEINGTNATLIGTLRDAAWNPILINVTYTGGTTTPPSGSPYFGLCLQSGASTAGYQYFTGMSGTVTIGGQALSVTRRGGSFQVGIGANLQNVSDLGASGWFTLSNGVDGDFNFRIANETNCGTSDPCASDNTRPTISGCPANLALTTAGNSAVANWTAPTAADNCSTPTLTSTANSGASFPVGSTTVTYTARDAAGNTATCSFVVTVTQVSTCNNVTSAGVIAGDQTICAGATAATITSSSPASGGSGTLEYIWLRSTTGCPSSLSQQVAGATAETFSPGAISTTTYFRRCARRAGCSDYVGESNCITITVGDNTRPVITCAANITRSTTNNACVTLAAFPTATATDNCGTVTVTADRASNFCFPVGTTTITYTARDAAGNTATCTTTVTVTNSVTCSNVTVAGVIAGDQTICAGATAATITSTSPASGGSGTLEYIWLRSTTGCPSSLSQQVAGATGETFSPGAISTTTYFRRCARRAGCSDYVGESNCITITVGDNTRPVITCAANITRSTTNNACVTLAAFPTATATDNCGSVTVTADRASNFCFPVGTTTITYTARDAAGNTATCTTTVTVTNAVTCESCVVSTPSGPTCQSSPSFAYWNVNGFVRFSLEGAATLERCQNGTAILRARIARSNSSDKFDLVLNLSGKTSQAPSGSPHAHDCQTLNTAGWEYYTQSTGTLTGVAGSVVGKVVNVSKGTYPALQIGNGANTESQKFGGSSWLWADVASNFGDYKDAQLDIEFDLSCPSVPSCPNNSVAYRYWDNITAGSSPVTIPTSASNGGGYLTSGLKWQPVNHDFKDNYVLQARGYITFPTTGDYQFRIAGDDNTDLYLNSTTSNSGATRIAYIHGWTNFDEFTKYPSQHSATTHRTAGQASYVEVRLKEFSGADFFQVQWKRPGSSTWELVPASVLSPYCGSGTNLVAKTVLLDATSTAELHRGKIEWVNNSGASNDFFAVQKLNAATGEFENLHLISEMKRTDELQHFVVYDENPQEGDNYYRVQLVLANGAEKFSEIQKLTFKDLEGLRVFPNPTDNFVDIDLKQYEGKEASIFVYNKFGQTVHTTQIEKVVGATPYRVELHGQPQGAYIIRVVSKGRRDATKQLIITN